MPRITKETPLTGKTKSGVILTEKEELFCNLYLKSLGDGIGSAFEAYNVDKSKKGAYNTAKTIAWENLTKPHILERIRDIFDDQGLNNEIVDVETSFLVKQRADNTAKAKGIEIFNRLEGRYEKDNKQKQPKVTVNIEKQEEIKQALNDL